MRSITGVRVVLPGSAVGFRGMQSSAEPGIKGFEYTTVEVGPTSYAPGVAGTGPPVLMLHGFPQTHYCWHSVAPRLTPHSTVVVCDRRRPASVRPLHPGGGAGGARLLAASILGRPHVSACSTT